MTTIASPRATSPAATPVITSPSLASIASPTGTPTSSLRPSLDLPTPTTTDTNPTQRRNRAALRDYYKLKSRPDHPGSDTQRSASITSTTSTSTNTTTTTTTTVADNDSSSSSSALLSDLDNPTFSAENFITSLLDTASLHTLLKTESALVAEIRTLDGERKALVYDNYSKLIKAVGTIGEVQRGLEGWDGVEGLEGRVAGLEEEVRGLGGVELSGEGDGDGGWEEVERRMRERGTVRWVLGAEGRLRRMASEEAEREWRVLVGVLGKWKGVKGVEDVRRACEEVMRLKREEAGGEADDDGG